ncbi:MAG: ATP-binding protein, partial [Chloroflexi bacterium]|nr:ATP-binding protein [Chloroflexota bacterium]
FRLLHALGRCCVFVDEADQALGKRDSGASDGGMSGRIYSMIAAEMSDTQNRGKIIWILASSRPDLIEVDLKRPGRIDVKIPLLPTTTPAEGFELISALCARRGIPIPAEAFDDLQPTIPDLLTPGAAESLVIRVYRLTKIEHKTPAEALKVCLAAYQPPVPPATIAFQIQLAVQESSEVDFVPMALRGAASGRTPVDVP